MLKYILWYLFIGVVFNFIIDMSTEYARKRAVVVKVPDQSNWNWTTRIMSAFIWPIGIIFYLKGYINERYKTKK